MLFKRFRDWLASRTDSEPETDSEEEEASDIRDRVQRRVFSTDLLTGSRRGRKAVTELTMPNFSAQKGVGSGESVVAGATFDSALKSHGMDSVGLKQQFTLQQLGGISDDLFDWFSSYGFIGYQACAIASQHWLVNNALMIPAEDAVRNGYTVDSVDGGDLDPKILAKLRAIDKKYKIPKNLVEFALNTRRFGVRIAIFNVESNDKNYYEKPFNIDGVKPGSYKGITQVDPTWVAPVLDSDSAANPASMGFYEPTYWMISGQRYHHSHVVVARYVDPPDILKPMYQYGGISLTQMILERVYGAERTANEAPMLTMTKRLNVLYADLVAYAANPENLEDRLRILSQFRDNYGVYLANHDDKVEQIETSLADLDTVIMTGYQLVASVSGIPATKLMGTSPKGLNASGEFEIVSYHERLESIQADNTPLLDRHHELAIKSEELGDIKVEAVWNPVSSPNAKEQAELNLLEAQRDQVLEMTSAIDAREIRDRLIADPKSGFSMLEPYDDAEEKEEKLDFSDNDDGDGSAGEDPPEVKTATSDHGESNTLGYVSISPDISTGFKLHRWAIEAGILNPSRSTDFHATMMWSRVGIPDYEPDDSDYTLKPTGEIGILGENPIGLVIYVESPELRARVATLEKMGAVSDYSEFLPHVCIKYDPAPGDLEKARAHFAEAPIDEIVMGGEMRQAL